MKIALLSPIEEAVPPKKYGGIEAVVYNLAEELHRMGHDVTLFASGDSKVSCRLVPLAKKAIGSNHSKRMREAYCYEAIAQAARLIAEEGDYDIVHNNIGFQALLFKDIIKAPMLTTMHWTLDNTTEREMYSHYRKMPFVSISNDQRKDLARMNYVATVHHGIDMKRFTFNPEPEDHLVFFGRFSPVKGPLEAIKFAKKTKQKLIMAGKINDFEREYFDKKIAPHIDGEQIIQMGELDHDEKVELLGKAKALLSPIQWDEPFGLVNIEAMACGTPVITTKRGSLPEIVVDGKTGFLCKTDAEIIKAIKSIDTIDRRACRDHVEEYFSVQRMVKAYIDLYRGLIRKKPIQRVRKSLASRIAG